MSAMGLPAERRAVALGPAPAAVALAAQLRAARAGAEPVAALERLAVAAAAAAVQESPQVDWCGAGTCSAVRTSRMIVPKSSQMTALVQFN